MRFLRGFVFCLLVFLVFWIVGMAVSGLIGAGDNQGLAGGAIIVGYGFIVGCVGLILALSLLNLVKREIIVKLNYTLSVVLLILAGLLTYRFLRQKNKEKQEEQNPIPSQPAAIHSRAGWRGDESALGVGFYSPDFYSQKTFYFYPEPTAGKALDEHQAYDSLVFVHSEIDFFKISYAPPSLVPAHLKMDYELLFFRVKRMAKDYLEIVVNETTGRTTIVDRLTGKITFWPDFILNTNTVEFPDGMEQAYKIKPLAHASDLKTEKVYPYMRPESVSGFWLEVSLLNEKYQAEGRAWIKWRDEYQLLVNYSLLS